MCCTPQKSHFCTLYLCARSPRCATPCYVHAQTYLTPARLFTLEDAGHSVAFEQFKAVHRIMVGTVLSETYPGR